MGHCRTAHPPACAFAKGRQRRADARPRARKGRRDLIVQAGQAGKRVGLLRKVRVAEERCEQAQKVASTREDFSQLT